jgi:hypothetical protein
LSGKGEGQHHTPEAERLEKKEGEEDAGVGVDCIYHCTLIFKSTTAENMTRI